MNVTTSTSAADACTTPRAQQIQRRLSTALAPLECVVTDESTLHAGHVGAAAGGGHFRVRVVSTQFDGLTRLARQRLVYHHLEDLMPTAIHALSLTTLTPAEALA